MLALQFVYLGSLEGEEACHLVTADAPLLVPGRVNLIESGLVTRGVVEPRGELFLSTWAATESPREAQDFIPNSGFFAASRLLLAYLRADGAGLRAALELAGSERREVLALTHEGYEGHEYAFR